MKRFFQRKEIHKALIPAAAFLVVGVLVVLGTWDGADRYVASLRDSIKNNEPLFPYAEAMRESDPVRLRIPEIYVDTNFIPLGLQTNGEIEVPEGYTEVGWYTYGPTPGEMGPAVVLGHVDSYQGPGVFLFLGQLEVGDYVYVDREDGTTATFRVTALERYNTEDFPTEKVYGDIDHAGLRLITCSGAFNRETQLYDRTLVVYASLVEGDSEMTE